MATSKPPKMNIKANKPKITSFAVAGKDLRAAKKALDKRRTPIEWGLYDSTRKQQGSAKVDENGKVTSVTVIVNPVIEMPKWRGYSAATKAQKASWDNMYKALLKHENGHHKVQLGCMEDLKKKIKNAKDLDGKKLKEMISGLQSECQKKQDAYDSGTGHGLRQGVVLDLDA